MSQREIMICGEPVLRKKARRMPEVTEAVQELLENMVRTMLSNDGLGLAAPQVGKSVQAIVMRADGEEDTEIFRLVNPRLVETRGEVEQSEGCLSLPTLFGRMLRPQTVVVAGLDAEGRPVELEADERLAQAVAHEIDHLRGRLFIDRALPDSLRWMVPDPEEEEGYRWEPTTLAEALAAFERMRERRRKAESG